MVQEGSVASSVEELTILDRRLRECELILNNLMDKMIDLRREFSEAKEHPCSNCQNKIELVRLQEKHENVVNQIKRLNEILKLVAISYGGTISLMVIQTIWAKVTAP